MLALPPCDAAESLVFTSMSQVYVFILASAILFAFIGWAEVFSKGQVFAMLPDAYASTHGQEREALGCVLADPTRDWPERTLVLAGRAALDKLRRKR